MCFALWCGNFPHPIWPPSLLASKSLSSPFARNHLRGLLQKLQKLSTVCVSNNAPKQAFLPFEDGTLCGLSVQIAPWRMRRRKQSNVRQSEQLLACCEALKNHTCTPTILSNEETDRKARSTSWCLPRLQPGKLLLLHTSLHVSFETMSIRLVSLPGLKGLLNTA